MNFKRIANKVQNNLNTFKTRWLAISLFVGGVSCLWFLFLADRSSKWPSIVKGNGDAVSRLNAAEKIVDSSKALCLGNTDSATSMASRLAFFFNRYHEKRIDKKRMASVARLQGTYCEVRLHRKQTAVFICHLYGYAKSDESRKKDLQSLVWEAAFFTVKGSRFKKMVVAIRDEKTYCSIQSGDIVDQIIVGNTQVYGAHSLPTARSTQDVESVVLEFFKK